MLQPGSQCHCCTSAQQREAIASQDRGTNWTFSLLYRETLWNNPLRPPSLLRHYTDVRWPCVSLAHSEVRSHTGWMRPHAATRVGGKRNYVLLRRQETPGDWKKFLDVSNPLTFRLAWTEV